MYSVMDDTADCMCSSALALNCCQFAFFTPNNKSSPRCCSYYYNDWMSKLDANKKLRDVVMPGTHNSASSTISKWALFSAVARCQNLQVHEQLLRGARYLDIRINNDIHICHGMVKGGTFSDVLNEVNAFLHENENEFLIVEIKDEAPMTLSQKTRTLQLIQSTFGERMISYSDLQSWFQLTHVTMGDIRKRRKNVLVLISNSFCFDHVAEEFSCHLHSTLLKNKWHNSDETSDLLHSNLTHLRDLTRYDRDFLICNQFVLTPQPPCNTIDAFRLLFGLRSIQPISLVRNLYRNEEILQCSVRDRPGLHWNIVSLDFIDMCEQFVSFLISLNDEDRSR